MPADPRLLLLTGSERRHRFVAMQLARQLDLTGMVMETKAPVVRDATALPAADQAVIEQHFRERDAAERRLLGEDIPAPAVERLEIGTGEVNSAAVFEWVLARRPDAIILYGTGIVRPPLLEAFAGRVVNLHLGLSPYYRGSGTNFWPLVNGEPECVGATIHLAVLAVDAGAILGQVRPDPELTDRAHELGTKTIMAAAAVLPRLVLDHLAGRGQSRRQDLSIGRVYRNRDFTADAVRKMWQRFDAGMMRDYLAARPARRQERPIVEVPAHD